MTLLLNENFELETVNQEQTPFDQPIDFLTLNQEELEGLEERIENFLCDQGIFICDPKDKQREYFKTKRNSIHKISEVSYPQK